MRKSIHRDEYAILLELLREQRTKAGITQVQASKALGRSQSFISDVERGSRRLDLVQLRDLCHVLEIDLVDLVTQFEDALPARRSRSKR